MNRKSLVRPDLKCFLDHEIYPSLYQRLDSAFSEFGFKRKGNYWEATDREYTKSHFNARPDRVMAYENTPWGFTVQGGEGFYTLFSYIANKGVLRGKDFIAAVQELASKAGVSFPEGNWAPEEIQKIEKGEIHSNLLEAFLAYTKTALLGDEGKAAPKKEMDTIKSQA